MNKAKQGYWAGMPKRIKVLSALTVLMMTAGGILLFMDVPGSLFLIGLPIVIILIRFALGDWFGLGGASIMSYSFDYWFDHFDKKYSWFSWAFVGLLVVLFGLAYVVVI